MSELTQEYLKSILHYDPLTGTFTRLVRTGNSVKVGDIAGWADEYGYTRITIQGRTYRGHRLAFLYMTGEFPEEDTDHIDGITSNNRWENLRAVATSDNMKNIKLYHCNKSGVPGVYWTPKSKKWRASIRNGKLKHIGYFDNIDEAIAARKSAEVRLGFHPNHGRAA